MTAAERARREGVGEGMHSRGGALRGQPEHVLVIGAGLGGLRTVEQLRASGYEGRISLVGEELHPPYDRPPLSKQLLAGAWEPERIVLREPEKLDELGVRYYLGVPAVALRPGEVELSDGSTLHADAIVIATGVVARRLPGQPERVHTLRTLDDALALRAALEQARSLLVIGGGFIGAEVASTAKDRGLEVTVLEALAVPFSRALGDEVGAMCGRLATEAGITLRTAARLEGFLEPDGDGAVAVELADGTRFSADVAIVGVGGTPQLDWLADTGLDVRNGLVCDASGRVRGLPGVWAVGDVAAWENVEHGRPHRSEHWANAGDQAAVVAAAIAVADAPPPAVPYFWSDQFGLKIQLIGRPELADATLPLHGDGLSGGDVKGTVVGYLAGDRLVAVAGFGAARRVARYRALLGNGADRTAAQEFARSLG
ncbi:NAD(P)/FAD-dependent oxidoreductase [Pseudonocardia asaccharolytica]|uniref:Ferredoxin reductase n=1 Tax=Pseudonocardia asaccharolytica DSM 44247 = NBRC 16224 TaxID=1123024 RepID=A0A511D1M2_9PSEU|nr:FAD-dependent oxidoreductase [Pseudonocardia asaccharolytica]GEL18699.1 ferredoxin reductase [Pseudonocardia asaccharolytica DSM 44247 = NBRC 16224]